MVQDAKLNGGLRKHMALHDKVKGEYNCEVDGCGKTFTNASYLKRHMVTHDDKPTLFTCPSKDCIEKKKDLQKQKRLSETPATSQRGGI